MRRISPARFVLNCNDQAARLNGLFRAVRSYKLFFSSLKSPVAALCCNQLSPIMVYDLGRECTNLIPVLDV